MKIGDFGSAKYLQAICSEQGVDIMGTPHYTAPEIVKDSRKFDQKSDIWSVGITVVEMLTAKTPWWDVEASAVHLRIAYDQPQYQLPEGCSEELRKALCLMLLTAPEKRPTAADLLRIAPFKLSQEDESAPSTSSGSAR